MCFAINQNLINQTVHRILIRDEDTATESRIEDFIFSSVIHCFLLTV